jgi:hypothetical protein
MRQYRDKVLIEIDPFRGGPLQLVQKAVEAKRIETREATRGRGRLARLTDPGCRQSGWCSDVVRATQGWYWTDDRG